jgi:hypothetical protein
MLRVICEVDPPRPSAVGPAERRRELAGDLDNIILKAMHKEPARRYASMDQLADDLGRWLDGRPVAARTQTVGYRARKFVRRNKAMVIAATLVASTLIAATVVSLRQAGRADEQAARAEIERTSALAAATRAEAEADRARKAEAATQASLDELKAETARRARAEAEARDKGNEAELSREQLQVALVKARQDKKLAEEASARAEAFASAEKATKQQLEVRLQKELAHVRQLEEKGKEIVHTLH